MTSTNPQDVGQRIATARRRRGLSQAVLAGLVGRSESWLSQVERGKRKVDSHAVLTRLAVVLHTDIAELAGTGSGEEVTGNYPLVQSIRHAMMGYDALDTVIATSSTAPPVSAPTLRTMVTHAYRDYQGTRYEQAGRRLASLIRDVEAAARISGHSATMSEIRALTYDATAALLARTGDKALAWAAADRALAAAEMSGTPLLAALSAYRLCYVLSGQGRAPEGTDVAMRAAQALEQIMHDPDDSHLSIYGGLHLAAATAAAADYDCQTVSACLQEADRTASRLGRDANVMGTAFGPTNVALHTMSISVRLGDANAAVRTGEAINAATLPAELTGRRAQVQLDLARAYAMRKQDAAAVNVLLAAEKLSPQLVRYDKRTRDLLTGLLQREHRPSTPQLRPLAHRAGVI
jgi:transcriptional regulator with XRE-family HTH domain